MKQIDLFGNEEAEEQKEEVYTKKIKAPIYEPKNKKPHILNLLDNSKSNKLINQIKKSNVSEEEKTFLIEAAKRHNKFHYKNIADYYAHSSKEMQDLMEKSALVIIDFDKAIKNGYIKLSKEMADLYFEEYVKPSKEEGNGQL